MIIIVESCLYVCVSSIFYDVDVLITPRSCLGFDVQGGFFIFHREPSAIIYGIGNFGFRRVLQDGSENKL